MARGGLASHLHEAVDRAKKQGATVRKQGLRLAHGSQPRMVALEVIPLVAIVTWSERYSLVLFEDGGEPAAGPTRLAKRTSQPG